MKIAFYILTILVCGVAAYFSLSHREMFVNQQKTRLETIATNKNVTARADATLADISALQDELTEAQRERSTQEAALESIAATGRTINSQLGTIESTIATQEAEITRLNEAIADVSNMFAEFGGNITPATVAETIASMERQRDELSKSLEESEELLAAANRNLEEKRAEVARVAERAAARNAQLALNATEAVITAVSHEWGFVLIGAGSNSGFAPQSAMIVQRDGRVIGRIRPSSIEPTQTIAEIDYSTLSAGVRLQPGDRVLLATPVAN